MIDFIIKNKELIIILSGIGTFISSLIAIFTLIEVKRQRLALYKPDILIKSFFTSISKSPLQKEKGELILFKTSDFNDYSNKYKELKFEVGSKYKVENLGFGIAKNIKCEWNFDTKKAIKFIEKNISNRHKLHFIKELNLYTLEDKNNEDYRYASNANIRENTIDYISPINIQKHFHFHTIPEIITFTHYLYFLFELKLIGTSGKNFHIFDYKDYKFPNPVLKISYKDLNGKKYKKKFKFKVSAISSQIGDISDLKKDFGYLQFEII